MCLNILSVLMESMFGAKITMHRMNFNHDGFQLLNGIKNLKIKLNAPFVPDF